MTNADTLITIIAGAAIISACVYAIQTLIG